jgi:glycosidase
MEFHISRELRDRLQLDDLLFSYAGNVVFGNVAASRKLAQELNQARGADADPAGAVNAGALFAMGLIDELNHALVARYRKEVDPSVLAEAMRWFATQAEPAQVEKLLLKFTEQFPNMAIYRGQVSATEWLKQTTEDLTNREAAIEELLLLWVANINPAFKPFRELFEDKGLKQETIYQSLTEKFPDYFSTRPQFAPEIGSLWDALRAPMIASPDSLTGQLDFIREHWAKHLGEDLRRVLLAIDVLREEDLAIWMRFHPPGPDQYRHGAPTWGSQGFVGDEFVGFDEYMLGPDGKRLKRYSADYQAPLEEYEAFSADQAWMPNVVLMAKSTYVWLEQLSKKYLRHIHRLDQIPDEELQLMAHRGITALWLIGLWERSTASRTIKRLRGHADAVASAYSLKGYQIADDLGGNAGYEHLKHRAAAAGLRLASDMVPNHMGIDSDWVIEHPDWFLYRWESPFPVYQFNGPDLSNDSRVEIKIEDHYYDQTDAAVAFRVRHHASGQTRYMYHGNDGTTFAWNDTAQLDYSQAMVREHVIQAILHVARLFPIIRFDAAMVLAKRHVQRLWFPLPGAGGSIPSRAENAMSQEEFDALMPHEFWREVVDRVAVEVPGTLLLAEAFWLLEGYFVRTLGMHRVYNSAFMNMLRDEENAKYRSYLKKTIEFDPDIMKRYVNFMSNPDERTSIDQFGDGDKYFGVATLLATLPGLPMFGHGQIEGYTERYGMEYKQAKMDERPREELVARHQAEIAPLLKRRYIFAESSHFILYDFWNEHGTVDENVFAYSNRNGDERSIVLYNNRYENTRGSIHVSAAAMDKGSGELRQRKIHEGLNLSTDDHMVISYRDSVTGLEYLRRASDIHWHGMSFELSGFQRIVLLDWRHMHSTAEHPWDWLCDELGGAGVRNLHEELSKLRLRPLHQALWDALSGDSCRVLDETAREGIEPIEPADAEFIPSAEPAAEAAAQPEPAPAPEPWPVEHHLNRLMEHAGLLFERAAHNLPAERRNGKHPLAFDPALFAKQIHAAAQLPSMQRTVLSDWPVATRTLLPSIGPEWAIGQSWAPVLAWLLMCDLPCTGCRVELFDHLHLRGVLADIFTSMGMQGDAMWRSAARLRILLAHPKSPEETFGSAAFWAEPDVRWLCGVNESDAVTYFNKEQFEEMWGWLHLPVLIDIAERKATAGDSSVGAEIPIALAGQFAAEAGFQLDRFIALWRTREGDEEPEPSVEASTPLASVSKS